MSYSDRNSVGAAGGVGGVLIVVLLIGLRVGLKAAARASRNVDWSAAQNDNSPSGPSARSYNPETMSPVTPEEFQLQADWLNQKKAEQQAAQAERDRQNIEQLQQTQARLAAEAEQQRVADAQRESDRLARLEADRVAREQELANLRNNPPAVTPPIASAAPEISPAPGPAAVPAGAPAEDVIPGFAVAEISQVKPRDKVFIFTEGKWNPGLVQVKRGQLIQVRYSANGNTEAVTIDRLRLENEPVAKVASGLPGALRAIPNGPRASNNNEPEDDSLFVAKPKKDDEQIAVASPVSAVPGQPAVVSKPKAAGGLVRTWTDDTGTFKVDAELMGFEFGLVQLKRKTDGKVLSLPIEKLSAPDQQVVRDKFK